MLDLIQVKGAKSIYVFLIGAAVQYHNFPPDSNIYAILIPDLFTHLDNVRQPPYSGRLDHNPIRVKLLRNLPDPISEIRRQTAANTSCIDLPYRDIRPDQIPIQPYLSEFIFNHHRFSGKRRQIFV